MKNRTKREGILNFWLITMCVLLRLWWQTIDFLCIYLVPLGLWHTALHFNSHIKLMVSHRSTLVRQWASASLVFVMCLAPLALEMTFKLIQHIALATRTTGMAKCCFIYFLDDWILPPAGLERCCFSCTTWTCVLAVVFGVCLSATFWLAHRKGQPLLDLWLGMESSID